jgi:hypothetical protein
VAVTIPDSGKALVILTAQVNGSTGNAAGFMSVSVSGNTTVLATDANSLRVAGNEPIRASATALLTNLNPGLNVFTAKYREVGSGFATFADRNIVVVPLG